MVQLRIWIFLYYWVIIPKIISHKYEWYFACLCCRHLRLWVLNVWYSVIVLSMMIWYLYSFSIEVVHSSCLAICGHFSLFFLLTMPNIRANRCRLTCDVAKRRRGQCPINSHVEKVTHFCCFSYGSREQPCLHFFLILLSRDHELIISLSQENELCYLEITR